MNWSELRGKLEFGDFLIPFYTAVFVRQFFWGWDNSLAWTATSTVTILLWTLYFHTKANVEVRTPRVFWLVVGLPLFFIYAIRAPFPDLSFDVLNHRLIQSERALQWAPFFSNDFFPTIFPFNPSPDMLMGIGRMALGYRLGTIINLMVLLWVGTILYKVLGPFIQNAHWRSLGVLLILFTEHTLFQINNYMVDLLALPLLLEATRLALRFDRTQHPLRDLLFSGALLGIATGLKLTNIAMVLPIIGIFVFRQFGKRLSIKVFATALLSLLLFFLPLLPHAIYIYRETGNPFFPLYNNLIRSPFWPPISPGDGRWGPRGLAETVLWPLMSLFVPGRLSELGVYAGRLSLSVLAALVCIFLPRTDPKIRLMAGVILCGSILWSAVSGYIRYVLFLEILGGILLLYLSYHALMFAKNRARALRLSTAGLPLLLLSTQVGASLVYALQIEWSMRPTLLTNPASYFTETQWLLRDRELSTFLPPEAKALFGSVDAWIVSGIKTNGIQALLRNEIPMLAIHNPEYFDTSESRKRFEKTLNNLHGKRLYSLVLSEDIDAAGDSIVKRGLESGKKTSIRLPFFSHRTYVHMTLIEVRLAAQFQCRDEAIEIRQALPEDAFKALISVRAPPTIIRSGERATLDVSITNISDYVWPVRGQEDGRYYINVGNSWLSATYETLNNMDGRSTLLRNLCPAQAVEIPLTVTAPSSRGDYILEIDIVQEGVAWFKDKGSETLRLRVRVE